MEKLYEILDILKMFLMCGWFAEYIFESRDSRGTIILVITILLICVLIAKKIIKKNLVVSK